MSADLTADGARQHRDALASRTDVLDKVKVLVTLPRTTYVTTELVAGYYEVDKNVVEQIVSRNRDELGADGYTVLRGDDLTDFLSVTSQDRRAPAVAVFPVRAVLRVGMLLRDSAIARQVRDHLLNVEQASVTTFNPAEITRADMARMILAAEEELAVVSAALKSAEPAIAYHDRFVANDDACTVKTWAAQFGLTQPQAFDLLVEKRVIYKHPIGQRWSAKAGRVVDEREYRARAGRQSFAWFDLRPQHNAPRHHNGQVRQTLYVRQGYALELARLLGLGGLNAIGGAA